MNRTKIKTIYTIGYTSFPIDEFLDVLHWYKIDCLIDVRSVPYSAHHKDFNKDRLQNRLRMIGIHYRNYAREFGARQEENEFLSSNGYLDFSIFTQSEQFNEGVAKLRNSCEEGYCVVLMCAEKDPMTCHRSIMIGRALKKHGFDVEHILANRMVESQTATEGRLLDEFCRKHKINRFQKSMFADALENLSNEQLLELAYKEKNSEIGHGGAEE